MINDYIYYLCKTAVWSSEGLWRRIRQEDVWHVGEGVQVVVAFVKLSLGRKRKSTKNLPNKYKSRIKSNRVLVKTRLNYHHVWNGIKVNKLSACLSTCLPVSFSVYPSVCLSSLSVYPSNSLSFSMSTYLFIVYFAVKIH